MIGSNIFSDKHFKTEIPTFAFFKVNFLIIFLLLRHQVLSVLRQFLVVSTLPCLTQSDSDTSDELQAPGSYEIVQECKLISKQLKQALESYKACGIHTRQQVIDFSITHSPCSRYRLSK